MCRHPRSNARSRWSKQLPWTIAQDGQRIYGWCATVWGLGIAFLQEASFTTRNSHFLTLGVTGTPKNLKIKILEKVGYLPGAAKGICLRREAVPGRCRIAKEAKPLRGGRQNPQFFQKSRWNPYEKIQNFGDTLICPTRFSPSDDTLFNRHV